MNSARDPLKYDDVASSIPARSASKWVPTAYVSWPETNSLARFAVAPIGQKSYSYSMKWYSYSYPDRTHRVRVRVPPLAEYEYESGLKRRLFPPGDK